MEQLILPSSNGIVKNEDFIQTTTVIEKQSPFIIANTQEVSLYDMEHNHIIPVYVKDNEPLISHYDFIKASWEVANYFFGNAIDPLVRMSHPIKGRIPDARNKPASELQENEKTLYYERMMFIIEVPSIYSDIDGNKLTLTIGGVKAYNLDNLNNKKGSTEHFKIFIGFKNLVCCNLCVSTDGLLGDLRVSNLNELRNAIYNLIKDFEIQQQLEKMNTLTNYSISENQFAQIIGKSRMYQYLSSKQKANIPDLRFGETQINIACRDYYNDQNFCKDDSGNINLWKLQNLLTGSNKSSYIDSFLSRAANATDFVNEIAYALKKGKDNWFLN